jgi:tRNA pseudouridine55 synthase
MNTPTKKQKNNISGWLVLDKPEGLSSTQALGRARWALNAAKAGHGGTLDPFATGVLPIALGEATKLMSYVLDGDKIYQFTVRWGEARDTDDLTGAVTQTSDKRPTIDEITAALPRFTGTISQMPPRYSALHINGERAYDLARQGKDVPLKAREVTVKRFTYLGSPNPDEAEFEVECAKGTYIRALARDLGETLTCLGHVKTLKRLKSGPFTLENALTIKNLLEKTEEFRQKDASLNDYQALVLPLAAALDDIPALLVSEQEAQRLRQGQDIRLHPLRIEETMREKKLVAAKDQRGLVALAHIEWDDLQPVRVFNIRN